MPVPAPDDQTSYPSGVAGVTSAPARSSSAYRYSSAATAAPTNGPIHHTYQSVKLPDATAGPNQRAGFIAAPVSGPPMRTSAVTARPMARPPIFGARRSTAVPKTASSSTTVRIASTMMAPAMPMAGSTAGVPMATGPHEASLNTTRNASAPAAAPRS